MERRTSSRGSGLSGATGPPATTTSGVKGKTTPAKKIPYWLWVVIAKSLGIKLHDKDRPIISAILHICTFGSALGLFVCNTWYSGYNIVSVHTKSDILDGTVSIFVMSYFCGLGVYSHRLAYRLFIHPKFVGMMRLHSKTIVKINSALVIFVVLLSFVICLNISTVNYTYSYSDNYTNTVLDPGVLGSNSSNYNPCQLVDVTVEVCQVYWVCQMIFSVFFLVWNLLVAVVLVSVARTQTISIRRFLKELEQDAYMLDAQLSNKYFRQTEKGQVANQFLWMDDDALADYFVQTPKQEEAPRPSPSAQLSVTQRRPSQDSSGGFSGLQLQLGAPDISADNIEVHSDPEPSTSRFVRLSEELSDSEDVGLEPRILHEEEIMLKHWRIVRSVRLVSVALQRWMSSITLLITAWTAIRMVYWLSHHASLYGVFMFILPLLLLPLFSSSYAEVNYEGGKVLPTILPTAKRVEMFQYLYGQPIQMTVYGHAVTYGTIGTVVAGILVAFASKIFLQEINDI